MALTSFSLLFSMLSALALPAQAATIINLADQDKTVELQTNDGFAPVTIPAGRNYFSPGKVKVRFMNREVFIEHHEEYAIWPDNSFGPQRRFRHLRGM